MIWEIRPDHGKELALSGLADTLASDAAQELVNALVNGLIELAKKLPLIWRRSGVHKEGLISAELDRSATALREADPDQLPGVVAREEGNWGGRLRDLLAEYPDSAIELRSLLDEIRLHNTRSPRAVQNINASLGGVSYASMYGNVNHYERRQPDRPDGTPD